MISFKYLYKLKVERDLKNDPLQPFQLTGGETGEERGGGHPKAQ